jgi:hypothetical protein
MTASARGEAALAAGRWVKWIAGASNQDLAAIEDLAGIYVLAGVHCLDVAADRAALGEGGARSASNVTSLDVSPFCASAFLAGGACRRCVLASACAWSRV